jgi:hypothetical protein
LTIAAAELTRKAVELPQPIKEKNLLREIPLGFIGSMCSFFIDFKSLHLHTPVVGIHCEKPSPGINVVSQFLRGNNTQTESALRIFQT